jgi:GNAT superfamily N-acetyltransferase
MSAPDRPMTAAAEGGIHVRIAEPADRGAVLDLLEPTLGWSSDDSFGAFYAWKHEQNPFGPSPSWVAVDGGEVVGLRIFLRWEHVTPGGEVLRSVRAVDTATRPSHQGRGIFRRMTLHALDDLRAEGVAFVFNTPNDSSRPGYLKMGWTQVGHLAASVRLTSPASPWRMARARVPADIWSVPSTAGRPATEVLAAPGLPDLLASVARPAGLRTHRTPAFLRWRYSFGPLAYRAVTLGDDVRDGVAIFRVRRRGPAVECALCDVLAPAGEPGANRALVRSTARASGADYVIRLGGPAVGRDGFVRAPQRGPILTWRPLGDGAPGGRVDDWALALGDIELF